MKRHRSQKKHRSSRPLAPRRLRTERLEARQLLAADLGMARTFEPADVNRDGHVSEIDALMVIDALSRSNQSTDAVDLSMDVNRDSQLSPLDALWIINRLNSISTGSDSSLGDDALIDQPSPGITSEETYTIDNTAPTVAISRQTPSAEVTNADSVTFLLNFSEDVVNVTADDFEVTASGVTTGEITIGDNGDSDESTYSVSIASISGDGVLDLDFASTQDITDLAGNPVSPHSEDAVSETEAALLLAHEGYWVGQATLPGSPVPATFVNDIHVDTETGYVTVYAQVKVGNTIVSPIQVGPGETGTLPDGSTLAAHPNAVYLNGSGQELMEADGTGTWWVKHAVIAEEGYYNVEVEAEEYVEVYVEGELQADGSIRVGGVDENTGAVGFNIRDVNTDTDPDTYTITRYRPANIDPSAGPIDLTPVPDLARSHTMQRSAGVSPFDGTVYQDTEDPASSNRGQAYTELIAVTVNPADGSVTTEVWGTQGTDTSPEAAALIDLEAAAQQLGATQVILNGPRYLLADAGTLTSGETTIQTFGELEMQRIGSIELDLASAPTSLESDPYVPQTVSRNTDTIYYAGSEIYQLTSPVGEMYVMQSTGTEIENADLAGLGDRLTLPEGWVFEVITLEEPLRVTVSDGNTIDVLVDDLGNAYGYVGIDPLRYHDGYFVGELNIPGFPPGAMAHQDVYVDYETERVTIYAQTRVGDQIFAPPQIGPGETTTLPNGQPVSFHPDAVYLNGSGQELMESDGTGQWWVKHSWINGGEGYDNTPVFPAAEYPELYVEGDYFQGGPTIRIGGTTPETESYYNLREPLVDGDPNAFRWTRYEPANDDPAVGPIDLTPTQRFSFDLYRTEAVSAFDGSQRTPFDSSSEPTDPTPVASLTANPNPAPTGSNITLTATPVVTAAQVVFFRESNGAPGLQNTDMLVGTDTNGADGWTASVNVGTTPGTFAYYAVPVNANGPVAAPMATTIAVQDGVETAIPNEPADQVYTTADGVEFVRTPDEQFENLPDWPYEPKYVEIDGLRQAYIDEGPEDGPVVLLLHGQPSWSYLYRDMIPVLVDAGYRVIAMDHLGMGRSDKPTDVDDYTYEVHIDRLEQFIGELGLQNINLFAQDWGSLIGLHVAGENPEWFASIAIGNGNLPVIPAGTEPFPPVLDTDVIVDVPSPFTVMPAQQIPFRDADGELLGQGPAGAFGDAYFGNWMNFAMTGASFKPSDVVEAMTWFDIPADEQAAYDAPFPTRAYMAGPRSFPSVINDLPGVNDQAWAGLGAYDKPFVTIWGGNDPGNLGGSEVQQRLIDHVPGSGGQPHTRLPEASHFLQDDQGEEIATQLVAFYQANGIEGVDSDETNAQILSAYLGAVDVPIPGPLEAITGAEQQAGDDGMPLVFSTQIDGSTLSPDDFEITTASGATTTPTVATLAPADESDELRTVLLAGPLGSSDDVPVSVTVIGSLQSIDGEELQGLTSEVTTNEDGAALVSAVLDPAEMDMDGNQTTPARVQTTWQGGVTGMFGSELGPEELLGISLIDVNGDAHSPVGFEDLGDQDNHVVLVVPEGVTPVRVDVKAGTLYDPTNQPNPETSIEIVGTTDLEDEPQDDTLRDLIRDRISGPLPLLMLVGQRREPSLGRMLLARRMLTHVHETVGEHGLANMLNMRMEDGIRGSANLIGRATRLTPALVDAALQSDAFDDPAELLLSTLATQRIPDGLRARTGRFF
ncbi:haloalkane dehalogenase [Planctomycetaceae bacterium SH139]